MSRTVKLPDSGMEVQVKSMSWDESEEYMDALDVALAVKPGDSDSSVISQGPEVFVAKRTDSLIKPQIIKLYGLELFDQIKGSRKDVSYLWRQVVKETFPSVEEQKN